jgi:hypothetical protein
MPWRGSDILAQQFATAVNNALGFRNGGQAGADFAYGLDTRNKALFGIEISQSGSLDLFGPGFSGIYNFATASLAQPPSAVPGPLPLLGAAAGWEAESFRHSKPAAPSKPADCFAAAVPE